LVWVPSVENFCDITGCNHMVQWLGSWMRLRTAGYVPWYPIWVGWTMVAFTVGGSWNDGCLLEAKKSACSSFQMSIWTVWIKHSIWSMRTLLVICQSRGLPGGVKFCATRDSRQASEGPGQ